jgi:hypothetical protein
MGNQNRQSEKIPVLVKVVAAAVFALFLIPLLIFTALPNMFFGYGSSETEAIARMTEQAMIIGGIYTSLEDFDGTQVDSIVTSIAGEYEQDGTTIDQIEVTSDFGEEDLLWLIAINSVAHQQDLNAMSAEDIRSFCSAHLILTPSLDFLTGEGDAVTAILKVKVQKPDPQILMDSLGFEDDAKTWTGALFEILRDSDALAKYAPHFEDYRPSYEGDNSFGGGGSGIEHGGSHENGIDTSGFISPGTKNNLDLAAYAVQAWENNWGYVWGTYGNILTESLFAYKLKQYPDGVGNYKDFIRANWLGRRTADCVGLIKGYGWLDASSGAIRYGTNGMPDYGANQMYQSAAVKGDMSTMPEIKGLAVWKPGHIGIYIGGGYVVEAMSTRYGVVKTAAVGRGWQGWCQVPSIDYIGE